MLYSRPYDSTNRQSAHFCTLRSVWSTHEAAYGRASHLTCALKQDLVIFVQCHQENDRRDVFEAVDPFPPLWTLTPNINHPVQSRSSDRFNTPQRMKHFAFFEASPEYDRADFKGVFDDSSGRNSNPENILLRGHIQRSCYSLQIIQVTKNWNHIGEQLQPQDPYVGLQCTH